MSKRRIKKHLCPNCEAELPEHANFCPSCGQENHTHTMPFGHLLYEFVESITHFDAKLWNTLKAIVTKPGQFVVDFVRDRRARYVPPARLYVFVSVIFFLLVNKVSDKGLAKDQKEVKIADTYGTEAEKFTLNKVLGDEMVERKGIDKAGSFSLYYNKQEDPTARTSIARLKRLSVRQVDSLIKEQVKEEELYKPTLAPKLHRGIAFLPAQLPSYYVEDRTNLVFPELEDVIGDSAVDANKLLYAKEIRIPFDSRDSLGTAGLTAMKRYNDQQLLDLYGITQAVVPEVRDSILAEMKKIVLVLPDTFRVKSASPELTIALDYKIRFGNDSVRKAEMRLARTMSDDQLVTYIENRTGKSLKDAGWFKKNFLLKSIRQTAKLNPGTRGVEEETLKELIHIIIKYISWVMFFLMPIVAFVLLIIYFRKQKFYYEHLIFSVHTHTVFFMILSIALTITYFSDFDSVLLWAFLLGFVYLLLAMKRTYAQGWLKTILKFMLFTTLYGLLFLGFLVMASVLGFLNF